MPYAPRFKWLQALPLRAKLTILNTLVVSLVAVVALVSVRHGLRWMLLKELEVALEDEVYELSLAARSAGSEPRALYAAMAETSAGHMRHGWFLQLYEVATGNVLWNSVNTPAELRDAPWNPQAADTGDAPFRFAYRKWSPDIKAAGHAALPVYVVRVGTALDFINTDVANVTRIISPVLALVFLLAPLGGYLLAGWATAPLQRLVVTSRKLHPSRLEERLPVRQTGDELDELSGEINQFLDQIGEHLRRNREFVANAAHELRSPLSAMTTSVDVALSRPRSDEEYQSILSTIHDECHQLNTLANQLLLLAESDAGLLGRHRVALRLDEVVSSSLDMFAGVAEEQQVDLSRDIEPRVLVVGDAPRLWQVVNNLLDNAIKFTPASGRVRVTLRSDVRTETATLTVRDTGVGVPAADLPFVFDRFYQVDRSRSHDDVVHGTGLGLSICRAVVEAYGGTITVASEPGEGTLFTVSLPRAAPEASHSSGREHPAAV